MTDTHTSDESDKQDPYRYGEYGEYYDGDELGEEIASLRPRGPEGRTTWAYMGLLGVLFLLLIGFSWACDTGAGDVGEVTDIASAEVPSVLTLAVDADIATMRGSVPTAEVRDELMATVGEFYDQERMIDGLSVDENVVMDGGSIRVAGVAVEGDERPDQTKNAIIEAFGLADGGTELRAPDAALRGTEVEVQLSPDGLVMIGQVPDEQSLEDLTTAGGAYWPQASVDTQLLQISDLVTWEGGSVRLTGSLPTGDGRADQLAAQIREALGDGVEVNTSAVTVDVAAGDVSAVEDQLLEMLKANPILFAPTSAEIETVSDEILVTISEQLNSVPDAQVEIVGHTDDLGEADENLTLSLERAEAVKARLVDLGVDEGRLTTRGEGESQPLVDEDTPEAREQNRRIEFLLVES